MREFLVQIGETRPDGWQPVQAESKLAAVQAVAEQLPPGRHTVYLVLGLDRHANGAPVAAQRYNVEVLNNG
jgi:hypothetical protein